MLTFDEANHLYKLDGKVIPSVTQILKEAGLSSFGNVPEHILEPARIIGKHVHKATELADLDMLDRESLDPLYLQYLESWESFKKDYQFKLELVELELFHPILKYAGRIDRVGLVTIKNRRLRVILDEKTGIKTKEVAIQTAGYKILFNHGKERKFQAEIRMAVYLKPTGYKVETFTNKADENIFISALNITNYLRSN